MGRSRSSGGACGAVFKDGELTVEEGDNVFVARVGKTSGTEEIRGEGEERERVEESECIKKAHEVKEAR